jgi:hypothetical protein
MTMHRSRRHAAIHPLRAASAGFAGCLLSEPD